MRLAGRFTVPFLLVVLSRTVHAQAPAAPATAAADPSANKDARESTDAPKPGDPKATDAKPAEAPKKDLFSGGPELSGSSASVFSDDWWTHTRPVLELHGYFRTRAELFHNFALGRHNDPNDKANLWPQPIDHSYVNQDGAFRGVVLCDPDSTGKYATCSDKSQASANLRLRLNPEIHISDNLRILSQIDLLDNVVLGSTPDSYAIVPSRSGGYATAGYNGYAPASVYSSTQGAPTAGVNSWKNSIEVKRAWAEYLTPVGQLRFGRMPNHWGMGMVLNSGDGVDQDYQTNTDRIMFVSAIRSADLYFGGSWNFASTGPTSASPYDVYGSQPYSTANRTNVGEWFLFASHKMHPEAETLSLARGDLVLNGGAFGLLRTQELDVSAANIGQTSQSLTSLTNNGLEHRGAFMVTPDLWLQLLWKKLRFEAEGAMTVGSVAITPQNSNAANTVDVRMGGFTGTLEYRAVEDKLRLAFGGGWASGDSWLSSLNPGANPLSHGRSAITMFRFHPAYNIDLILHRRLLSRVQGTYYFRPSVDYDFIRQPNGQKFGGGLTAIWTRASEYMQTPGHKRDLGLELDLSVYYQSKDGSLNDNPSKLGGFYAMLQYGVLFPLAGFDYTQGTAPGVTDRDLSSAQTVRLHLGAAF